MSRSAVKIEGLRKSNRGPRDRELPRHFNDKVNPMNGVERAAALVSEALSLGLDAPTEGMIAEAIHIAEHEAILHWEVIAARHGQDWGSVQDLLKREKTKQAKERRWNRYLAAMDCEEDP